MVDPALVSLLAPLIGAITTFILMAANYYFKDRDRNRRRRDDDPEPEED